MRTRPTLLAAMAAAFIGATCQAAPAFVNALVVDGRTSDASGGTAVNDVHLGFFSDLDNDARR